MHDANDAVRMNLYICGLETKVHKSPLWKWRFGFHVASTQAEIRQFASRNRVRLIGWNFCSIGEQPGLQLLYLGLGQIQKSNTGLAIGIRPGDLPMRIDLKAAVRQRESQPDQGSWLEWLCGQQIHSCLAQVQHDSFKLFATRQRNLYRRLHWNTERAPSLSSKQRRSRA